MAESTVTDRDLREALAARESMTHDLGKYAASQEGWLYQNVESVHTPDMSDVYMQILQQNVMRPLDRGISPESIAQAFGMYLGMTLAFPGFRDSIKKGKQQRLANAAYAKAMACPDKESRKFKKWARRCNDHLKKANGGRLPYNPESAAFELICLEKEAYNECHPKDGSLTEDELRDVTRRFEKARDALIKVANVDGVDTDELARAQRVLIGKFMDDPELAPEYAPVFKELSPDIAKKEEVGVARIATKKFGRTKYVDVDKWNGEFIIPGRDKSGRPIKMEMDGIFTPRFPETASEHHTHVTSLVDDQLRSAYETYRRQDPILAHGKPYNMNTEERQRYNAAVERAGARACDSIVSALAVASEYARTNFETGEEGKHPLDLSSLEGDSVAQNFAVMYAQTIDNAWADHDMANIQDANDLKHWFADSAVDGLKYCTQAPGTGITPEMLFDAMDVKKSVAKARKERTPHAAKRAHDRSQLITFFEDYAHVDLDGDGKFVAAHYQEDAERQNRAREMTINGGSVVGVRPDGQTYMKDTYDGLNKTIADLYKTTGVPVTTRAIGDVMRWFCTVEDTQTAHWREDEKLLGSVNAQKFGRAYTYRADVDGSTLTMSEEHGPETVNTKSVCTHMTGDEAKAVERLLYQLQPMFDTGDYCIDSDNVFRKCAIDVTHDEAVKDPAFAKKLSGQLAADSMLATYLDCHVRDSYPSVRVCKDGVEVAGDKLFDTKLDTDFVPSAEQLKKVAVSPQHMTSAEVQATKSEASGLRIDFEKAEPVHDVSQEPDAAEDVAPEIDDKQTQMLFDDDDIAKMSQEAAAADDVEADVEAQIGMSSGQMSMWDLVDDDVQGNLADQIQKQQTGMDNVKDTDFGDK